MFGSHVQPGWCACVSWSRAPGWVPGWAGGTSLATRPAGSSHSRVAPVLPVTPVTPSADSLQFILMQQMQQQLFQLQQQFTTFQVPAPPPDAALQSLMGRSGASRSIIFTSPPSASASSVPFRSVLFRSVMSVQTRTRMNCKKAGLRLAAETADTSDRPTPITVIPYSIYHSQWSVICQYQWKPAFRIC